MSTGYEFERFYAEVEKRSDGTIKAHVKHQTGPAEAFNVGIVYGNENACRRKAAGFNRARNIGYDAMTDTFSDMGRHQRWEDECRSIEHDAMLEKKRADLDPAMREFEAMLEREDEFFAGIDQAIVDRQNDESSMAYEGWGNFGTRSEESKQDPGYTANIITGRHTGFKLGDPIHVVTKTKTDETTTNDDDQYDPFDPDMY